jgi:large subunit ribosomal protein L18
MGVNTKSDQRVRRKGRIRKRVKGTQERPRLSVFRSARHIYAQIIDDTCGCTLVCASSLDQAVTDGAADKKKKVDKAVMVGKLVAERAKAKGIAKVVFDRNGFLYHGRVKAVSDGAREAGLEF